MIYSDELLAVAKRIFWFGTAEEALESPSRFLTYAMTYASDEDIGILRKYFSDDDFKAALDSAAGNFRSMLVDQVEYTLRPNPHSATSMRPIPGVDPATVPDLFPAKP